jgi:hypothetical protein
LWAIVGLSASAFALRLLHLGAVKAIVIDTSPPLGMDRWLNMEVAAAIARGEWLGGWAVPYDSSPGYSYVLAALYVLSGGGPLVPTVVQVTLGAFVPLALAGTVRRSGSAAAVPAALLAALYLPAIFYETLLVKFALVPVTTAALLYATTRIPTGGRVWTLAAGVLLAALGLLRPNALAVAPVMLAAAVLGADRRTAVGRTALLVAGAALLLVPSLVRDHVAAQRGVAPALGGIHFYIGTNPHADGEYVPLPGIRADIVGHLVDARREAERQVGRRLTPEEASRFWFAAGLDFIRQNPARYLLLELRKAWFLLEANEHGSFGDEYDALRPASPVLQLPLVTFGTIMPLAMLGVAGCFRRRAWVLPAFTVALFLSLLPFFVAGRYRLVLAPPMIALAAIGFDEFERLVRRRGTLAAVAAAVAFSLVGVLFGADDVQILTLLASLPICVALIRWLPAEPALG